MGKSIRSKRLKRLRTIKRELVTPHYDAKELAKLAVQEAALAAPKIVLPNRVPTVKDFALWSSLAPSLKGSPEELEQIPSRGRSGRPVVAGTMEVEVSDAKTSSALKAKGGIKKRGRSRSRKEIKSKRKKQVKF